MFNNYPINKQLQNNIITQGNNSYQLEQRPPNSLFFNLPHQNRPQQQSVFTNHTKQNTTSTHNHFSKYLLSFDNSFQLQHKQSGQTRKQTQRNIFGSQYLFPTSQEKTCLFEPNLPSKNQPSITIYPIKAQIFSSPSNNDNFFSQVQHNHVTFKCSGCNKTFIKKDLFTNNPTSFRKEQADLLQMQKESQRKDQQIKQLTQEIEKLLYNQQVQQKMTNNRGSSRWEHFAFWELGCNALVQSINAQYSSIGHQIQHLVIYRKQSLFDLIKEHIYSLSGLITRELTTFEQSKRKEGQHNRQFSSELKTKLQVQVSTYSQQKIEIGRQMVKVVADHCNEEMLRLQKLMLSVDGFKKQVNRLLSQLQKSDRQISKRI